MCGAIAVLRERPITGPRNLCLFSTKDKMTTAAAPPAAYTGNHVHTQRTRKETIMEIGHLQIDAPVKQVVVPIYKP